MAAPLSSTPAPDSPRPGQGGLLVPALGLFALLLLLRLPTYNCTDTSGDLGKYLNETLRLYHGDLPYRDFWLLTPPGDEVLGALIFRTTGINVNAVLLFYTVVGALGGVLGFLVAATVLRRRWLALLVALGLFFVAIPASFTVLLFGAVLVFLRFVRSGSRNALPGASVLVGVALFFDFYLVGAALVAMALTVAGQAWREHRGWRVGLAQLATLGFPALGVAFLLYLPFHAVWPQMLHQFFSESPRHGTSMPLPYFYDSLEWWRFARAGLSGVLSARRLVQIAFALAMWVTDVAQYLLPGFMAGLAVWFLAGRRLRAQEKPVVIFLLLWALLDFPKALARSDLAHLWNSAPPMLLALGIFLEAEWRRGEQGARRFLRPVTVVAVLTALLLPTSLVSTVRGFWGPRYAVTAPHGRLLLADRQEAADINAALQFIDTHSRPGDYIFVSPWFMPAFYALTDRRDPTYYDSLIDPVALPSREKQEGLCRDLLSKPTRIVLHNPDWGFDDRPQLQWLAACPLVQQCLEQHFNRVATYGRYWVYVRKTQP